MTASALRLALLVCVALCQACSMVTYSMGSTRIAGANIDTDEVPETEPLNFAENTMSATTHEVSLLDHTGNVCASFLSALDKQASRAARIKKAERERQSGVLTYEWNEVQAEAFSGYPCGFFLRWTGDGAQAKGFGWNEINEPWFGEFGMHLHGWDPVDFLSGLYTGGQTRPSVGFYSPQAEAYGSDRVFLRLPIHLGLRYQPPWGYGAYVQAMAGGDIVGILLGARSSIFRTWHAPIDYSASIGYSRALGKVAAVSAQLGYNKNMYVNNDDWMFTNGTWEAQLAFTVGWGKLFD